MKETSFPLEKMSMSERKFMAAKGYVISFCHAQNLTAYVSYIEQNNIISKYTLNAKKNNVI